MQGGVESSAFLVCRTGTPFASMTLQGFCGPRIGIIATAFPLREKNVKSLLSQQLVGAAVAEIKVFSLAMRLNI